MKSPSKDMKFTGNGAPQFDKKSITEAIAESEARQLDFDPSDRMKIVGELLKSITKMKKDGLTLQQVQETLGDLYMQYPELSKKIYSGEDMGQLELMMKMMEHMNRKELTPHQASVIVGRKLANDYIPPEFK
jgi:hypothetical protein